MCVRQSELHSSNVSTLLSSFNVGNCSNTSRRTSSYFQASRRVENTRRSLVFFKELRVVLESEEFHLTSV